MAAEPELSTAASAAVLSRDPDVERIRTRIGLAMVERLRIATGELCSDTMLEALSIAVSGAMVQAGMNYYTFEEMAARLTSMTELLLRGQ